MNGVDVLRDVLVMIHAGAGVAGLLLGLPCLAPPRGGDGRRWLRRLYALCLVVLLVALVALVAVDWADLDAGARIAFSALAGLGMVMVYRILRAQQIAAARAAAWQGRYIAHVYFTYVSLWVGLVILPALELPHPQVAVPLVAITVVTVGGMLVARYKRRVLAM